MRDGREAARDGREAARDGREAARDGREAARDGRKDINDGKDLDSVKRRRAITVLLPPKTALPLFSKRIKHSP